jgi:hypothetical protein
MCAAIEATLRPFPPGEKSLRNYDEVNPIMVGILVHGDNHFIVRGPLPNREAALALVRHWSIIRIGAATPPGLAQWQIISKEFRENLQWAVVVPGESPISPAVKILLHELSGRGVHIHHVQIHKPTLGEW